MVPQLITPNWHVALVHFPLGLLIAGALIEFFSFLWRKSAICAAAKWMILLGALAAIPTTFSGIYALNQIATTNNPNAEGPWMDVKAASPILSRPQVWQMLRCHAISQSIATILSVIAVVIWLGCSDRGRQLVRAPLMLLLLASIGAMIFGAWDGGESVYRHGVGVEIKASTVDHNLPILELHIVSAGLVVALAMAAIGMSCRKITVKHEIIRDVAELPADQKAIGETSLRTPASSMAMLRSFNPDIKLTVPQFAPAARFWLLAGILAILTAAGGIFFLVQDSDAIAVAKRTHQPLPTVLWNQVKPDKGQTINRSLSHVIAGVTIIITAMILAAIISYAPRQRFWMGFVTLILLVAVGSQIWLGILLLYDSPQGPITQFNTSGNITSK